MREHPAARRRSYIGGFEELVLLAVSRLGDSAYSQTIQRALAHHGSHLATLGAIHTTLSRLEQKGFIQSRLGDPQPGRGGRAKRYYWITAQGEHTLRDKEASRA